MRESRWNAVRCAAPAVAIATAGAWCHGAAAQSPFATTVVRYEPAPGQNVRSPAYSDPQRALGAPVGGGPAAPNNAKVVTLGGFGGSITLGFDHRIANRPPTARNPLGLDAIVFGNAFFVGGDSARRWAEGGVIEISIDANGNGLADDLWYVVPGSRLSATAARVSRSYDPANLPPSWVPPGRGSPWTVDAFRIDENGWLTGGVPVIFAADTEHESVWGYADCTPALSLGDFDGDGVIDRPDVGADVFYTKPDDPFRVGIAAGSCGGDAFDIAWAVDGDGLPANLPGFDFIRITTAVDALAGVFGEVSVEIGGVAEVRPWLIADLAADGGDPFAGPDGFLTGEDFDVFIVAFFGALTRPDGSLIADIATVGSGDPVPDGFLSGEDFDRFIQAFFGGE
ncbi:MAG: hypothetical protein KIT68_11500 [Phycisphaeraceae bacterium]|nr:hypothetical protein [Phycisphaeraceae bacterium]